mgnify:CR=1 FL=1
MHQISKLQVAIYITVIFIVLIVVFIVLGIIPGMRNPTSSGTIVIWGTFPKSSFDNAFKAWGDENNSILLQYEQKSPSTYRADLLEAIATGAAPDMVILPDTLLHNTQNKLAPLPALFMTERGFTETFTSAASSVFLQNGIIYGIPFVVDHMVLYWNKDFFASEAIALPPTTWDQFLISAQKLTKRAESGNLTRSGAAMGITTNIPQAVDIVILLMLQGGTSIVDPQTHEVTLNTTYLQNEIRTSPAITALRFYTDFARREKVSYTWNYTFPNAEQAFGREDLAMFLSRASVLRSLAESAPHVPIGVSPVPQYSGTKAKIGYATPWAFAVVQQSNQQNTAWRVASFMAEPEIARILAEDLWMAPARRDVLAEGHEFPPFSVFYEEAIRARSWYDPDPAQSSAILRNMIESVSAGRDAQSAVSEAQLRLEGMFK